MSRTRPRSESFFGGQARRSDMAGEHRGIHVNDAPIDRRGDQAVASRRVARANETISNVALSSAVVVLPFAGGNDIARPHE
jgi:hypothetical protein